MRILSPVPAPLTLCATRQGVAFEFLNGNAADPQTANTRCGVHFDNIVQGSPQPSPRGGTIDNPANSAATAASNGLWTLMRAYTSSVRTATVNYFVSNFNDALRNCGWRRDETAADVTVFRSSVRITTVQQGRSVRSTLFASTRETVVELGFGFRTRIVANSTLEVQSTVTTFSQLLQQVFEPLTRTAYLLFFTSSQGPYQLRLASAELRPTCTSADGRDCAAWSAQPDATLVRALLTGDLPSLGYAEHVAGVSLADQRRAQCFATDAAGTERAADYSARQNTQNPFYPVCGQYWYMELRPEQTGHLCSDAVTGPSVPRTLDGQWSVSFEVTCHPSYEGACTPPAGLPLQPQVIRAAAAWVACALTCTRRRVVAGECGADDIVGRLLPAPGGFALGARLHILSLTQQRWDPHSNGACARQTTMTLSVFEDFARTVPNTQFVFGKALLLRRARFGEPALIAVQARPLTSWPTSRRAWR